jgi:uncharacterized protein (TIGR00290 family)
MKSPVRSPARSKVWLSWSSGKDSAWALHVLRERDDLEVVGLLTTVNQVASRVAMHAVREQLLDLQAETVGLPLLKVRIPSPCSNAEYEQAMAGAMQRAKEQGIDGVAFGDLFLDDVRRYREEKLSGTGVEPLFPLWGEDTGVLARTMVRSGVRAYVTCVNPEMLDRSWAGRSFDDRLLDELPETVDPCGERGEFHTFVYEGPMFAVPLSVKPGRIVERDGFVFADVVRSGPVAPTAN